MRIVLFSLLAALAGACSTPPPVAPPPAPAQPAPAQPVRPAPPPTATPAGQRDLTTFVSFFSGRWDPKPGERKVRLRVVEFWKGSAARWLYLEWVRLPDDTTPARQWIVRVTESGERMSGAVYRLPGAPAAFAGEWRKAAPFAGLNPGQLVEVPECRLDVLRSMLAHFTMVTHGNRCPADTGPFPFMRHEFSITSSELDLLAQPRDRAGIVPKDTSVMFHLRRLSVRPQ